MKIILTLKHCKTLESLIIHPRVAANKALQAFAVGAKVTAYSYTVRT